MTPALDKHLQMTPDLGIDWLLKGPTVRLPIHNSKRMTIAPQSATAITGRTALFPRKADTVLVVERAVAVQQFQIGYGLLDAPTFEDVLALGL